MEITSDRFDDKPIKKAEGCFSKIRLEEWADDNLERAGFVADVSSY